MDSLPNTAMKVLKYQVKLDGGSILSDMIPIYQDKLNKYVQKLGNYGIDVSMIGKIGNYGFSLLNNYSDMVERLLAKKNQDIIHELGGLSAEKIPIYKQKLNQYIKQLNSHGVDVGASNADELIKTQLTPNLQKNKQFLINKLKNTSPEKIATYGKNLSKFLTVARGIAMVAGDGEHMDTYNLIGGTSDMNGGIPPSTTMGTHVDALIVSLTNRKETILQKMKEISSDSPDARRMDELLDQIEETIKKLKEKNNQPVDDFGKYVASSHIIMDTIQNNIPSGTSDNGASPETIKNILIELQRTLPEMKTPDDINRFIGQHLADIYVEQLKKTSDTSKIINNMIDSLNGNPFSESLKLNLGGYTMDPKTRDTREAKDIVKALKGERITIVQPTMATTQMAPVGRPSSPPMRPQMAPTAPVGRPSSPLIRPQILRPQTMQPQLMRPQTMQAQLPPTVQQAIQLPPTVQQTQSQRPLPPQSVTQNRIANLPRPPQQMVPLSQLPPTVQQAIQTVQPQQTMQPPQTMQPIQFPQYKQQFGPQTISGGGHFSIKITQ